MKTNLLRVVLLTLVIFMMNSCSSDSETTTEEIKSEIIETYSYSASELEAMNLINEYRVSKGLNALKKINHLSHKAEEHDFFMIGNNIVNHANFSDRSQNIISALGAKSVSENIAYNYKTSQAALTAWLLSSGHKENIEGNFTHFGISIRENPVNGRKYYTNIFIKI
ncbi:MULTISPECIES: CAP domain-containing protein [Flavobacterium]|jgi:uncharacterized protein YkwD|uniref:CAP domain-containing protein n=1 Tax=Flavobacterium TaxID=237 RepID=UPI0013E47271|nr:CAP domain-containing protein [Flavobacterium sp. Sr18]MDD2674955.1 CAP domain-containing protein [Flavobacterium sp.]QIH37708.1 CAP domain-containing protein [Flavobacterium sp. Sr18]